MTIGRTSMRCERCCNSNFAQSNKRRKLESFDLRLAIAEQAIRHQPDLPWRSIETELVPPGAEGFKDAGLPRLQFDIGDSREACIQNPFEVEDLFKVTRL